MNKQSSDYAPYFMHEIDSAETFFRKLMNNQHHACILQHTPTGTNI